MKKGALERLLAEAEAAALTRNLMMATGEPSAVWGVGGAALLDVSRGLGDEPQHRHAVGCDGEVAGWVSGGQNAELVAALLSHLLTLETDKEELLEEILDLYRQFNLLYGLSEKLGSALEPESVARIVLREANRLIHATWGSIVLLDNEQIPRRLASIGQSIPADRSPAPGQGWSDALLVGGGAEIINDVRQDPRYGRSCDLVRSLIRAPLTLTDEPTGAVLLASETPVTYTAADLKLLNSLASLAAPYIENALLHERKLQVAQKQMESLERLVEEMRIALDEAKQKQKVAEITRADYFQRLIDKSVTLKDIMHRSSTE